MQEKQIPTKINTKLITVEDNIGSFNIKLESKILLMGIMPVNTAPILAGNFAITVVLKITGISLLISYR
jgi:hypothetical protein